MILLPEAASESPQPPNETGGNSKGIVSLNSAFENINSLQNHRRVSVCRNKQFEEGYWKDFHN
jgi:hypothetical protein